jgi:diguanylate cyclase (GGDEF)-like protein
VLNWQLSLRSKLLSLQLLAQAVVLGLVILFSVQMIERSLKEQLMTRVEVINQLLGSALVAPLAQNDYGTIKDILQESLTHSHLIGVAVYESDSKPIVSVGITKDFVLDMAQPPIIETAQFIKSTYELKSAGQRMGFVQYQLSSSVIQDIKTSLWQRSAMIAVFTYVLTGLILYMLMHILMRDLTELANASKTVARGNFSPRLPKPRQDEIGELSRAFAGMTVMLAERVNALDSAKKEAQSYLVSSREQEAQLTALISALDLGVVLVDQQNQVVFWNSAFRQTTGMQDRVPIPEMPFNELLQLTQLDALAELEAQNNENTIIECRTPDLRIISAKMFKVHDEVGKDAGQLWVFEDITRERADDEKLKFLAGRDPLTSLLNRRSFHDELDSLLAKYNGRRGTQVVDNVCVMFFDLDEFKLINDIYGHQAGDDLLKEIARHVQLQLLNTYRFARLGGDEFAVFMPDTDVETAKRLAERIVRAVQLIELNVGLHILRTTASVGIASYPAHATDVEALLARADSAMYQAKYVGKNTWHVFDAKSTLNAKSQSLARWNNLIQDALANNRLHLHFQGIYDCKTRSLSHHEALIRMQDIRNPDKLISPTEFIAAAEKAGSIIEIDRWVIIKCIEMLAQEPSHVKFAVNISGRSLDNRELATFIEQRLNMANVAPNRLIIELTESAAMADLSTAQRIVSSLRQLGCQVCIDDFGTGFSSLAYLKALDVDTIKIDSTFIRDLATQKDNQVLVKAIVEIARGLGKTTIAESVEDEVTFSMLRHYGVDFVQGYLLDRPHVLHEAETSNVVAFNLNLKKA